MDKFLPFNNHLSRNKAQNISIRLTLTEKIVVVIGIGNRIINNLNSRFSEIRLKLIIVIKQNIKL